MTNEDGKEKAIQRYKILACLDGLVGVGLLVCAIIAVERQNKDDFGIPYFIGGFIVGLLLILAAVVCTYIFLKAGSMNTEISKREIGCAITGQYIVSMFTIMGCFMGCVMAGVGGVGSSSSFDHEDEDESKRTLAIIILLGCIVGLLLTIFSMCIVCTYGSYFGVKITSRRRHQVVILNQGGATLHTANPTVFHTSQQQANNDQISQLEAQNRLLQQQLDLQRQLQQQQQQTQNGMYPPPPSMYNNPAYPPTGAPPSYDDVK